MSEPPPRIYLVTPGRFDPGAFAALLGRALGATAVACVRLDLGAAPEAGWRTAADHLLPVCHAADVALVVAEHWRLVEPLGLDGVHLGSGRTPVRDVRRALGPDRIVGAFAGASRHRGMTLAEAGSDYVAFGPVGETGLLDDAPPARDDLFQWWSEMIETPSVAEGGLAEADARRLSSLADFVVPDRRLWDAPDPIARIAAVAAAAAAAAPG
jgi:thiamine-phosphate pyrophosphorylase